MHVPKVFHLSDKEVLAFKLVDADVDIRREGHSARIDTRLLQQLALRKL